MKRIVIGSSLFLLAAIGACANSASLGPESTAADAGPGATFEPTTEDASLDDATVEKLCVETECPAPYTTCPGVPGVCTTNLDKDPLHCGSCDNECPPWNSDINGSFFCTQGRCQLICDVGTNDCNGFVDDGCESNLRIDPNNCGACGVQCAAGDPCFEGQCGCAKGFAACNGECVRLATDVANCGACGHDCADEEAGEGPCGGAVPAHSEFNCKASTCGQHCAAGFGDCNTDFCGDGCETSLAYDEKNCGACGHECAPGQTCAGGKCLCDPVTDPGGTYCGGTGCTDLQTDPVNCGACGNDCKGLIPSTGGYAGPVTGSPACVLGRCTYECATGYGDCDNRIDNGCETDLMVDPRNCGGCGIQCDLASGQPCAGGQCLTKPCDAGVVH